MRSTRRVGLETDPRGTTTEPQIDGVTAVIPADLELAAWDIDGTKLWSRFVEPPLSYSVRGCSTTTPNG